ncbi:MAG: ABC-2 family transporter protein [Clostridia bacterium]|nr:ABC-2 family transporter protein [Clostridia bacterium]
MRVYLSTFLMRLKLETQYRAAAIGGVICQMFFGLILIYLYRTIQMPTQTAEVIAATATYVWFQQACFRMLVSNDMELNAIILKGDIVYQLVRPVDQYWYWFSRALAQKVMGCALRAAPMLVFALLLPKGIGLSLPHSFAHLLLCLVSLSLGFIVVAALEAISSGLSIRTLDNRGITAALGLVRIFLAGNIIPLNMFPDSWQRFNAFNPFAQIIDTPIRLYTGEFAFSDVPAQLLLQLAWTVALILMGRYIWSRNLKRVIVQGG